VNLFEHLQALQLHAQDVTSEEATPAVALESVVQLRSFLGNTVERKRPADAGGMLIQMLD
jgi:hypothetical protein